MWEPKSEEQNIGIANKVVEVYGTTGTHYYVGIYRLNPGTANQFHYASDNSPIGYSYWFNGEPNGSSDCVLMSTEGGSYF